MSWKRAILPVLALPVIGLLAYGLTRDPNVVESPLPGREAFDFTAPTLDGDTVRLSELRGKVVVLNFWASWCLACVDEHEVLIRASRRYPESDVQVLGVVYQDSRENARRWMGRMGGDWPSVLDPSARIAIDYGVYGVPETYFIGRDGRVAYKQIGPVNEQIVSSWVDHLLAGPRAEVASEATEGGLPVGRSQGHEQATPGESRGFPERTEAEEGSP
jgi:cytochrome c biogenesis protein CcmG/thiol:disulfide interchange protein DsbE